MNSHDSTTSTSSRWWKYGFFALLVVFEVTREMLVVQMNSDSRTTHALQITEFGEYVFAQGSWMRIDGGDPLIPSATSIECSKLRGECIETGLSINDGYVTGPDIAVRAADFSEQRVSFVNDTPVCVRYITNIDLVAGLATQVREKKADADEMGCSIITDARIEMHLVNGHEIDNDPYGGSFLPLLSGLRAMF